MADRILVFIPAYNCARQIGRVLAQFAGIAAGVFAEIVVIDNGSQDGTADAAIAASAAVACCPVKVVRNLENYNLGGSHKAAFAYARGAGFSHVAVLHGDDQGRIADLLPVLAGGLHRQHPACLGARFAPGAQLIGYSRFRILGNRVFNRVFSLAAGRRVLDLGSGLNIFARAVFEAEAVVRHADDLRFNVYLLLGMLDRGLDPLFFPISWREEDQVSNVRLWSQARRTLAIAVQYVFDRRAFRSADHRDTPRAVYRFSVLHVCQPAATPAAASQSAATPAPVSARSP